MINYIIGKIKLLIFAIITLGTPIVFIVALTKDLGPSLKKSSKTAKSTISTPFRLDDNLNFHSKDYILKKVTLNLKSLFAKDVNSTASNKKSLKIKKKRYNPSTLPAAKKVAAHKRVKKQKRNWNEELKAKREKLFASDDSKEKCQVITESSPLLYQANLQGQLLKSARASLSIDADCNIDLSFDFNRNEYKRLDPSIGTSLIVNTQITGNVFNYELDEANIDHELSAAVFKHSKGIDIRLADGPLGGLTIAFAKDDTTLSALINKDRAELAQIEKMNGGPLSAKKQEQIVKRFLATNDSATGSEEIHQGNNQEFNRDLNQDPAIDSHFEEAPLPPSSEELEDNFYENEMESEGFDGEYGLNTNFNDIEVQDETHANLTIEESQEYAVVF